MSISHLIIQSQNYIFLNASSYKLSWHDIRRKTERYYPLNNLIEKLNCCLNLNRFRFQFILTFVMRLVSRELHFSRFWNLKMSIKNPMFLKAMDETHIREVVGSNPRTGKTLFDASFIWIKACYHIIGEEKSIRHYSHLSSREWEGELLWQLASKIQLYSCL